MTNWKEEIGKIVSKFNGDYKDVAAECSNWLLDNVTGLEPEAYNGFRCPRAWWEWWINKEEEEEQEEWYEKNPQPEGPFYWQPEYWEKK